MSYLRTPSHRIGQELLDVPMGDMIRDMAFAIADAQVKLDENSIEVAQMLGGLKTIHDEKTGVVTFEDSRVFFGKEEVTIGQAVNIYNESAHGDLKVYIGKMTNEIDITNGKAAIKSGKDKDTKIFIPARLSMLELGFAPTFYQFVDTIIEVKIAIKYTVTTESTSQSSGRSFGLKGGLLGGRISTTQVNGSYSAKYSYSAEGSSLIRTKLVPIPPPAILEERIRQQMAEMAQKETPPPPTSPTTTPTS